MENGNIIGRRFKSKSTSATAIVRDINANEITINLGFSWDTTMRIKDFINAFEVDETTAELLGSHTNETRTIRKEKHSTGNNKKADIIPPVPEDEIPDHDFFGYDFFSDGELISLKRAEKVTANFRKRYPANRISDMTMDDYCIAPEGEGNAMSFCHMLRYEAQNVCSMGNAFPATFGIYYSDGTVKMSKTYSNLFGADYKTAFMEIKKNISGFLRAAESKDTEKMNEIPLNTAFKQKLACVYYPDIYFPCAVREYVRQSCLRLGVYYNDSNLFDDMIRLGKWGKRYPETEKIKPWQVMAYADHLIRHNFNMTDNVITENPYKE